MSTPKTTMNTAFNFNMIDNNTFIYDNSPNFSSASDRSPLSRFDYSPSNNSSSIETSPMSETNNKALNIIPFKFNNAINDIHVDICDDSDLKSNTLLPSIPEHLTSKHEDSFSILPVPKFYNSKIINEIESIVSSRNTSIKSDTSIVSDDGVLKSINLTQYFHHSSPKLSNASTNLIKSSPKLNKTSPKISSSFFQTSPKLNASSPQLKNSPPITKYAQLEDILETPNFHRSPKDIRVSPKIIRTPTPKDNKASPNIEKYESYDRRKSPLLNSENSNQTNSILSNVQQIPEITSQAPSTNLASLLPNSSKPNPTKAPVTTSFFNSAVTRLPSKILAPNPHNPTRPSSFTFSKEISDSVPKNSTAKVYSFGAGNFNTNPLNKKPIVNNVKASSGLANTVKHYDAVSFKPSSIAPPNFNHIPDTKLECELSPEILPRPHTEVKNNIPIKVDPSIAEHSQFNSKPTSMQQVKSALAFMHAQDQSVAFASGAESIINAVPTRLLEEFSTVNLNRIRSFDTINRGRLDLLARLDSPINSSKSSATNSPQLSGKEPHKTNRVLQKFDPFE